MPIHLVPPEALPDLACVLLDCRPGTEAYAADHLAGALPADLDCLLSTAGAPGFDPARGGRHPLPEPAHWARQLGLWGITPETLVVACDDASGGGGGARLWWMLRASGHARVAVLDGGLKAARDAGLPFTSETASPEAVPAYPMTDWCLPRVDLATVDRLRQDPDWKVLDVRARERWRGDVEPIDPVPGRIPGSVNLPWGENLDERGRFKPAATLRERYLRLLDSTPVDRLVVHCGSGVTACHTLLALELANLPGASIYMGSYSEWCRNAMPLG